MPTFYAEDIDIDVDEFLNGCSRREKEEIIDILIEEEWIKKDARLQVPSKQYNYSIAEADFEQALEKLKGKWNMLTSEEEQIVIKLASRF